MLSDWLKPVATTTFFGEHWKRKELLLSPASTDRVPFKFEDFEAIIASEAVCYPQLKCFDQNSALDPARYTHSTNSSFQSQINISSLRALAHKGITIKVSRVTDFHLELRRFVENLSRDFACPIHTNAYFCCGPAAGIPGHYDPHHVFAIQIFGNKSWHIGPLVVEEPNSDYHPAPNQVPLKTTTLTAERNSLLYLPPGLWHSTLNEEVSLHITVSIHPPTWIQKLHQILTEASEEHSFLRSHLPFALVNERCEYREDVSTELEAIFEFLRKSKTKGHRPQRVINPRHSLAALPRWSSRSTSENPSPSYPDATNTEIETLLDSVWRICSCPCSLYLRGSFSRPAEVRAHDPWDIDICLVVESGEQFLQDIGTSADMGQSADRFVVSRISKMYNGRQELDIKCVTKEDILHSDEKLLERVLLMNDGVLIYGEDLCSKMQMPQFHELGEKLKDILPQKIQMGVARVEAAQDDAIDRPIESTMEKKILAKAVLRLGTIRALQTDELFVRDPVLCGQYLANAFPNLTSEIELMLACVSGKYVSSQDLIVAARQIEKSACDRS